MYFARVLLVALCSLLNPPVQAVDSKEENSDTRTLESSLTNHIALTPDYRVLDCGEDYKKIFNIDIQSSWRCDEGVFPYDGKHPKPKFCNNEKFWNHCKDTCGLCKNSNCKDKSGKVDIFFKDWPVKCEEGLWNNGSIRKDYCDVEEFRSKCPSTCKVECGLEESSPSPTTKSPTKQPTDSPTSRPTSSVPTDFPSSSPSLSMHPSSQPTETPSTNQPTKSPTTSPTATPTQIPTLAPTASPTKSPSKKPTLSPTSTPTTKSPSKTPSITPTLSPVPSVSLSSNPSSVPTSSCVSAKLTITTDRFPYEIGWTLLDETSGIEVDKVTFKDGNYSAFETYEHEWTCLSCSEYNFTIVDQHGDGLCHTPLPEDPCGSYTLEVNDIEIAWDDNFKTSDSIAFKCSQ